MNKRIGIWLVTVCLVLCVLLGGCGDDGSGGGFRFPLGSEPRQLDPQTAADTASVTVLAALFEGLTRLDENGTPQAGAADWTVSADGKTYTFTLRESYWSTLSVRGEETEWDEPTRVTAADFVFGLQRAVSVAAPDEMAARLASIQNAEKIHRGELGVGKLGVRATDENTLVITLSHADSTLLTALASPACAPCDRDFFEYTGGRYGLEKRYLLTNGAFSLAAWNHGDSLLLAKHEGYHDAARILPQAVRYVIGTVEEPLTALEEGLIDAAPLSAEEARTAIERGIPTTNLQDRTRSVYFNTANTALGNADIRRALRDGIEWKTVYAYLADIGEVAADGYVVPAVMVGDEPYRTDDNARRLATNAESARTSLGKGLDALGTEGKAAAKPRLTVLATEDDHSANLARYLVQSWQKNLDISCRLELVSESTLALRVASGSYDVAIHTAVSTMTGGTRQQLNEWEREQQEKCETLPLSFPQQVYGIAANIEDIVVRPFGGVAFGSPFGFDTAKKWDD